MSDEQYKFLKWLTYGTYNELFEVIDDDGIRKPAIRTEMCRDVWAPPKGDKNFNVEEYLMTIDWRLLDRWRTKCELTDEDKAIAEKAAKLIARDYGEVLKRLEDE